MHTEKLSQRVFYVLVGLCVVVFGLFYVVGYDMPYVFNPELNAPRHDVSIVFSSSSMCSLEHL